MGTPPESSPVLGTPARGRYVLEERLAAGGMGVIYRARDQVARRLVAYKRLLFKDDGSRALRMALFQSEYETLARLPHPNIVEVFDYGLDEAGPYYAMELLEGDDLANAAGLPYREACRVLRDIASALALVHARRLVHRDVSPANVRLSRDGRAKLIDFGALSPFGMATQLVGTPACMPPEALRRAELDQRSDLYSLGVVAYWTLTRHLPFEATSLETLLDAFEQPPSPPSAHVPEIPRELDTLVLSLIELNQRARPNSAAYVMHELSAIGDLAEEPDERRVAYSYLAHPPLAGRDAELAALRTAVMDATHGQGRNLMLIGEPGLGSSALLDAAAMQAQLNGAIVLRAHAEHGTAPFELARTLLDGALALHPDLEDRPSKRPSRRSQLSLEAPKAPNAAEAAERRATIIADVQSTLLEVSRRQPLVILVDQVQASDGESLALLASLAQELDRQQLTLLTSARPGSRGLDEAALSKLQLSSTCIVLGALREDDVLSLVQGILGAVPNSHRLAQWLFGKSEGVPGAAMDLLRLLLARGVVRYAHGTFTLPHDIVVELSPGELASATLARLDGLTGHARELAVLLSLHEGVLSRAQLVQAVGRDEREVQLALEELHSRGVAARTEHGFAFASASLRSTLATTLSDQERREAHLSLAKALRDRPDGLEEASYYASWHFLRAGDPEAAASLVVGVAHLELMGEAVARWVPLLEELLAYCLKEERSKEECLSIMLPLATGGFFGDMGAQLRHADTTLAWMSQICGMDLARRLRPYLGGKLALVTGLFYAGLRRAFRPKRARLGELWYMTGYFVGLVSDATAAAISALDVRTAERYVAWLDPLAALPRGTPGYIMREFCMATLELGRGELKRASAHYAELLPMLSGELGRLTDDVREQLRLGCLHGRAVCEASDTQTTGLALAEELERDAFFAPYAEAVRLLYHGMRGDREAVERHRSRAELLAVRGGSSQSLALNLATRLASIAIMCEDSVTLVRAAAECERLAPNHPTFGRIKVVCDAWLEHLRGRSQRGLELIEHMGGSVDAVSLADHLQRIVHLALLNAVERYEQARTLALAWRSQGSPDDMWNRSIALQLAMAEAGVGNLDVAMKAVSELSAALDGSQKVLEQTTTHLVGARVALLAGDPAAFEHHLAKSDEYGRSLVADLYRKERDALIAKAIHLGFRKAPSRAPAARSQPDDLDASTVLEEFTPQRSGSS